MLVKFSESLREVSSTQRANAWEPMAVRLSGSVTEVSPQEPSYLLERMLVSVSGILVSVAGEINITCGAVLFFRCSGNFLEFLEFLGGGESNPFFLGGEITPPIQGAL